MWIYDESAWCSIIDSDHIQGSVPGITAMGQLSEYGEAEFFDSNHRMGRDL